ncbi:flagellar biosynthetic protein FliR [Sphingomonas sp. VNH70]|uniref:flagellar biosynthetic protein FliR n=1 Tax=Sphingomonas silueang TaxID=3156617 RepID=UPI0032B317E8
MDPIVQQATATLLVSLRIAPTLAFAQPFTLIRVPAIVRLMLSIALAAWLVAGNPGATWRAPVWQQGFPVLAVGELLLGIALALALQLAFAALLVAGRTIDIQAGYGLAVLVDPSLRSQMPLIGTVFAYAAGAVFFATDGPAKLLAIWAGSLERAPLGSAFAATRPDVLIGYVSAVFLLAFGLAGLVMLVLFLADLAVALMSRTLPQMNVLLLGFQVKTLATLAMLPVALALSGALFATIVAYALDTMAEGV